MKLTPLSDQDETVVGRIAAASVDDNGGTDLSHLKRAIVEIHNYCNRTCSFCLNAVVDRRSRKDLMDPKMFQDVVEYLALGNFQGTLMFGRFHEPLSDPVIIDYVAQAREILRVNRISLNTNGDYFTKDLVASLFESGLTDLNIMLYLPNGRRYSDEAIFREAERFSKRHGMQIVSSRHVAGQINVFDVVFPSEMQSRVFLHGENYGAPGLGCDRGGTLSAIVSKTVRETPCFAPFFELNVDFNGEVMPCCNLLSDVPDHRPYRMGNVARKSLAEIYYSESAMRFRERLASVDNLPPSCVTCQYYWPNRPIYEDTP